MHGSFAAIQGSSGNPPPRRHLLDGGDNVSSTKPNPTQSSQRVLASHPGRVGGQLLECKLSL